VTTAVPSRRISVGTALRCGVYGFAVGLIPGTLATAWGQLSPNDTRLGPLFWGSAACGTALALLTVWWAGGWATRHGTRRWLRALDVLALNVILALLIGEAALRVFQHVAPSRLLWDDSSVARSVVDRRRCEPGLWFRYRCNSLGYPDEEFFAPGPEDYSVALIADSFGVGSVPWSHHFATLAEAGLREQLSGRYARVAIDNRSVIGIDLPGYRYIFEHEVRGQAYRQVVLCLFVGNDMTRPIEEGRWQRLARLQGWLPIEVTRRLWLTSRGVERERPPEENDLTEAPAFLDDPALEPPYFTKQAFLRVEEQRALITVAGMFYVEEQYREALLALDAWHEELGSRLLIVVIPDEFQVNDGLWNAARETAARSWGLAPSAFQRDLPQRRIGRWAAQRGVRVLDLLPALRGAERESRTYHLRDTHWNAHGNRVAAHELARALAEGKAQAER
jgi:hypothetical protein